MIALSIEFWKNRGVESNTIDFLQFLTNAPCRIWNWFDLRWVVDETILSEDHQGRDPFILSNPGYGDSEYYSSVRIVDDGNLNRTLVESAVKLVRASGERIVINYLLLLDLFNRDEGWWLGNQVIEDGMAKLDNTSTSEFCIYNDNNMEVWQNYTAYFRLRGKSGSTFGAYFYCTLISNPATFRGYYAGISVSTNQVVLWRMDPVLSLTYLVTQSYASWGILKDSVWYGLRVQTQNKTTGGVNIRVYIDSDLIIEYDDNTYTEGGVGVGHFALSTCQLDEVEVFNLPADSKLIDINT